MKWWRLVGKFLLLFVLVFGVVYLVLNAPALYKKFRYWYTTKVKTEPWPEQFEIRPIDLKENLAFILGPQRTPEEIALEEERIKGEIEKEELKRKLGERILKNNHLYIPKIGVKAPIIWNVSEENALKALQNGVAHLKGTGLPGTDGNVFITGHSSYYWWAPGQYKTVFALLPNLVVGDKIYLLYQNQLYIYEVIEKLVVWPKDVWVMNKLSYPALSLMTCVPVGTNLRRLIVRAKQTYPCLKEIEKPKPKEKAKEVPAPSVEEPQYELLPAIF